MKEERICLRCNKPILKDKTMPRDEKIPRDESGSRGPRRKYHEECRLDAYKERDKRNKAEQRNREKFKETLRIFKDLNPKDSKELTKFLAQSLRNSIYASGVESKYYWQYRSDYKEVQEIINLIEEMTQAMISKNESAIRNIIRDEINWHLKEEIKFIKDATEIQHRRIL